MKSCPFQLQDGMNASEPKLDTLHRCSRLVARCAWTATPDASSQARATCSVALLHSLGAPPEATASSSEDSTSGEGWTTAERDELGVWAMWLARYCDQHDLHSISQTNMVRHEEARHEPYKELGVQPRELSFEERQAHGLKILVRFGYETSRCHELVPHSLFEDLQHLKYSMLNLFNYRLSVKSKGPFVCFCLTQN